MEIFSGYVMISLIVMCSAKPEFNMDTPVYSCVEDADCTDGQLCMLTRCTCKPNFISYGKYCYPEADYDDLCIVSEQCLDHRQTCNNVTDNIRRCTCDRFHAYDSSLGQCAPKKDLTLVVHHTEPHEEIVYTIEKEGSRYIAILNLGFLIGVGSITLFFFGVFYCILIYLRNAMLTGNLENMADKMNVPLQIERTKIKKAGVNDASIGPIMFDGVIIG